MDQRTPLHDFTWTALRIVTGLLIFSRGSAKLFGWFGGFGESGTAALMSRFGIAGVLETVCGALIIIGLFTRPAAFLLSGMLAVAYFWIHAWGGSIWWWSNNGMSAMLFSFLFLFFAVWGGGPYSLDARRSGTDFKA
jgi:putative oxidoreductase